MTELSRPTMHLPLQLQRPVQGRCVGPVKPFIEFNKEEIEQSIPDRFKKQVNKYPNRLAIKTKLHEFTYKMLNQVANRVARTILARQENGETPIALLLEHDAMVIAAILGVLKAGKIYVPLDPSYPQARTRYILEDSQAALILTNGRNLALASEFARHRCQVINVDELDVRLSDADLDIPIFPDAFAYILYTSGSTGRPKGVIQSHRNVLYLIMNFTNGLHICLDDRISLLYSVSVSGAVKDIFGALLNGAGVFPFDLKEEGVGNLASWLIHEEISIYHSVSTVFRHFLDTFSGEEKFHGLRIITLGGESVSKKEVEAYKRYFSQNCILHSVLGSTELSSACQYFIDKATQISGSTVPAGYAVAGTEVLLLDDAGDAVGSDCIGEIAFRSRYLTPGYWRKPDLTSSTFLPDPEGGNARIYRSGDLGRKSTDGCLEHLGRKDLQVKVRGYRTETAEIELALLDHPALKETAVVAQQDTSGERRLVAYVVSHQRPVPTTSELHYFLKQKLPDYMVPGVFMWLDALPLTPNGKVDRRALPALNSGRPELEQPYVPPHTPVEEILAQIWARVLGFDQIGIHDNFFELGGHSLTAMQVMSQLFDALQVKLPLRSLSQAHTVAGLADEIARHKDKQVGEQASILKLPTIVSAPELRHLPFPLTDIQQAYWIGRSGAFELGNVATHTYLEFDCVNMDLERLNLAWQRLIDRHDMLRAVVLPDGQQQILAQVPAYQIELLDLCGHEPQVATSQLEAIRQQMSHQIFPSDQWPLFEIRATRLDAQRFRLHFSSDALIRDASSRLILFREWSQFYENPDTPLAPLEISFRDYVLAEAALRGSDLYQRSQDYWWSRLPTLPPAPELPLVKNPRSITSPRFECRAARLEPNIWLRLKDRAIQVGLTPSAVLLATFAKILNAWSKSPRFTLNLTLFHRPPLHPQVNNLVGDFTSLLLLEVDNSAQLPFAAWARRLQEQLWDDLDHQYVSGVQVLRELARRQGREPRAAMPIVFTSILPHQTQASDQRPMAWLGEVVYRVSQTPQVWLDHVVAEEAGALVYSWNAVEELFPEKLLDDMFGAYYRLLQRLADDEECWQESRPESARQLLPPKQIEQRISINCTDAPIPTGLLHTFFAAQVPQRPLQPAVISSRRTLTYEDLLCRSAQVGHWLQQRGARPNTLVAVVMEKGWEQIVAVLGVLQSGAAYLPIDAELPKERLWYLLEHGEVELVLTQSWFNEHLKWPTSVQRLSVDTVELMGIDGTPLEPVQEQEDLAYVIYTSGSTGLPKGVMIDHRGAVNTIIDINQRFCVGAEDRVLALSSLSFDLSVYDIFGTLAAGGTIILPNASATRDPSHWAELMGQEQVTVWNSVPALMEMLIAYAMARPEVLLRALRLVFLSGDWIPVTLSDRIKGIVGGVQVIGLGGATEASIWSILYPIETVDPAWKSIPYGMPMVNQRFHVLNEALELCPIWVPGQLHIGGMGLAKGYWRDEERTSASFISHPRTGERLYRTGDLGRYLPDGNIEFLGREDLQVKLQGYRIELGEIEAALTQHPAVRVAVVTAVEEQQGKKRMVAYVVPNQAQPCTANASQSILNEKLIDDYEPQQGESALLDPIKRLEFRLGRPGLREESAGPSVRLIQPEHSESFTKRYAERRSYRTFLHEPISFEQFSEFLSCLHQIELDGLPKYRYASAGSLYPVQTYLSVKPDRVDGLSAGTYYYHPRDHCLSLLSANAHIKQSIHAPINQPIFDESAFSVFLIGQLNAITPMYAERARDFCLLEAGYMSQLLMTAAPASQLGLCPVGTLDFEQIRDLFVLEEHHLFLHSLLGGRIDNSNRFLGSLRMQASSLTMSSYPLLTQHPKSDNVFVNELRNFLKEKLPEYMVPSSFVLLDAMPLTPNGKVDRNALPELARLLPKVEAGYIAPQTEAERTIATIWQEVLHIDQVSVHHNFFDLGGHSLHIIQVHNKLQEIFQRGISITQMFQHPTISSLAKYLSHEQNEQSSIQASQARGHSRRELMKQRKRSN
jgi:amino acid adenylation domain-containing protein